MIYAINTKFVNMKNHNTEIHTPPPSYETWAEEVFYNYLTQKNNLRRNRTSDHRLGGNIACRHNTEPVNQI